MAAESARYVLAVDLGTGAPKVALVSTDGDIVGHEFEKTDLLLLPGGGAEQDPDDWWRAITTAAERLLGRGLVGCQPPRSLSTYSRTMRLGGRPLRAVWIRKAEGQA